MASGSRRPSRSFWARGVDPGAGSGSDYLMVWRATLTCLQWLHVNISVLSEGVQPRRPCRVSLAGQGGVSACCATSVQDLTCCRISDPDAVPGS